MAASIAARFIATWDRLEIVAGPDRLVIKGHADVTAQTTQSTALGVRYDQIDQLIIDLLTAKRAAAAGGSSS